MLPGMVSTRGRLLLATPPLADPNFDRSVVYMLEHNNEGAVGVVINRPTDESLAAPLDRWGDVLTPPTVVFSGGPVELDALIALGRAREPRHPAGRGEADDEPALVTIAGSIASVDLTADPALVAAELDGMRVFRGYAGWGQGQLEAEMELGSWIVVDSDPLDVVSTTPDDLWRDVLRRQPGRLAWLANVPDDLSLN